MRHRKLGKLKNFNKNRSTFTAPQRRGDERKRRRKSQNSEEYPKASPRAPLRTLEELRLGLVPGPSADGPALAYQHRRSAAAPVQQHSSPRPGTGELAQKRKLGDQILRDVEK
eukprot:tig00001229_g7854.t1